MLAQRTRPVYGCARASNGQVGMDARTKRIDGMAFPGETGSGHVMALDGLLASIQVGTTADMPYPVSNGSLA